MASGDSELASSSRVAASAPAIFSGARRAAWQEVALQGFAGGGVFQPPAGLGISPGPSLFRRNAGNGAREFEPDDSGGRRAAAGIAFILGREFDLPTLRSRSGNGEWKRSF